MTTNDILKLIDAGYTKDEIAALEDSDVKVVPTETPETKEPEAKPEVNPAESAQAVQPASTGVTLSDDQFTKLLQQLNVKGASLDVPPETDIKSKLAEHFKEITIGK